MPLILWFTRHGTVFRPDWRVRTFCYALVFSCLLIPIGTSARTGLLCIGLLGVLALLLASGTALVAQSLLR